VIVSKAKERNKAGENVMGAANRVLRAVIGIAAMLAAGRAAVADMPPIAKHGYFFVGGK